MIVQNRKMARSSLALAVAAAIGAAAVPNAQAYESPIHVFSINDIMGGFDGSTYGPAGADQDTSILCGVGGTTCPTGAAKPFTDRDGTTLYPIDSEFGFYVVDFVGAEGKTRDNDYMEGWAGNLGGGGVRISSSETDRYKVKPPLGTWCQGLGGNSVKCSTEHYTTMEHVLSCHETIPYFFADPITGVQGTLSSGSLSVNCATTDLDDELLILNALVCPDPAHGRDAGRTDERQRQHLGLGRHRHKRRLLRDPQGRRQAALSLGRTHQAAQRHSDVRPPGAAGCVESAWPPTTKSPRPI
jgi:NAD-dependent dihydropyrimidine dehydrogenase PreA subunit